MRNTRMRYTKTRLPGTTLGLSLDGASNYLYTELGRAKLDDKTKWRLALGEIERYGYTGGLFHRIRCSQHYTNVL
jgi:hypothetical protein